MFDIQEHGGGYGGSKNDSAISLYDAKYIDAAFLKKQVTNGDGLAFSHRRMAGGYSFSIRSYYEGNQYTIYIINKELVLLASLQVNLSDFVGQSYPISMICKLPDGSHLFSHRGNIYQLSSDFRTIVNKIPANTYGTGSNYNVVLIFISKSGQLVIVNAIGYVYIFNLTTFSLIGSPTLQNFSSGITSYAHSQIIEMPDAFIIKNGDSQGNLIKITKNISLSQPYILFDGHFTGTFGTTWDGVNTLYTAAIEGINKYNATSMALIAHYANDFGYTSQGVHYDKLADRVVVFGQSNAKALDVKKGIFLETRTVSMTDGVALYGYDDPDNGRVFIRGDFYLSSVIKK